MLGESTFHCFCVLGEAERRFAQILASTIAIIVVLRR